MNERTKQLLQLMAEHNLSAAQVGELVGRSAQTVRTWRCGTTESKVIPAQTLELLALKVAAK